MAAEQTLNKAELGRNELRTNVVSETLDGDRIRIERAEDMVQIVLAAAVPGVLAMMLFSFLLLPALLPVLFVAAIAVAALAILPACRLHRLHFRTWSQDRLVPKLMTSLVGMIYITVISVFAVSMLSLYEGLDPQQPGTFATVGGLLLGLLVVMGYSSRTKDRYLSTEKRFFSHPPEAVEERLAMRLDKLGHKHTRGRGPKGGLIELEGSRLEVHIRPLDGRHTEVLVRNIDDSNRAFLPSLKACVEGA